jgi:hypothetical protein
MPMAGWVMLHGNQTQSIGTPVGTVRTRLRLGKLRDCCGFTLDVPPSGLDRVPDSVQLEPIGQPDN